MSEGSSDEGSPGWEFVKNEDLVETSDGESVEVIGFSCPEESDTEDVVVQGEEVQVVEDDVAVNVQTFDLVEVKKEVVHKNPSNVWESFVVIMAVTSVGLAVTAFLFHAEDIKLDSWTSESSAELSVALEELQKYQKVNIALNKEINQLMKVIQHLEIQASKLEVQKPDVRNENNLVLEVDEESKFGPVFVDTHSDRTNLDENLLNLTSNFKLRSDSLKKGLKTSIDDLNNQVAHNILKTSWDIRNKLHQFGHFDLLKECGKTEIKEQISPKISETIDAITKEVAFAWMKFYEEVLEKKLDEISHEITHNIENNNSIFNDFLTHFNSSSQFKHERKTEKTEKAKKGSQKVSEGYKEKGEGKKHKMKEEKQHKKLKEEKQHKKLIEEKQHKQLKEEKQHKQLKDEQQHKQFKIYPKEEKQHKKLKEEKQHKQLKEEKQHKKLKEEKQHKKFEEANQRRKIKEKKEKTKSRRENGKKDNNPVKNENYKREKTSYKEKKKGKENQTFYFDKKNWKYVKFSAKNKTRLNRPNNYKLNKNCFNKTFNTKKEGWWFTDLGKHRSGIRWQESRSEWQFDRARNRRLRKVRFF